MILVLLTRTVSAVRCCSPRSKLRGAQAVGATSVRCASRAATAGVVPESRAASVCAAASVSGAEGGVCRRRRGLRGAAAVVVGRVGVTAVAAAAAGGLLEAGVVDYPAFVPEDRERRGWLKS